MEKCFARKVTIGFIAFVSGAILFIVLLLTVIAPVVFLAFIMFAETVACGYCGLIILRLMNLQTGLYIKFITGLLGITIIKVLLIVFAPNLGYTTAGLLYLVLMALVISLGLGALIDTKFGVDCSGENSKLR
jgi:hypothetical protein